MLSIALVLASNLAWAIVVASLVRTHRQVVALADARETARDEKQREHVRHLEDQLVLMKVEPQVAVAKAVGADVAPKQFTDYDNDEDFHAAMSELD